MVSAQLSDPVPRNLLTRIGHWEETRCECFAKLRIHRAAIEMNTRVVQIHMAKTDSYCCPLT